MRAWRKLSINFMNKKLLQQIKKTLEKEKEALEDELQRFAKKDKNLNGNWNTKFPSLGEKSGGSSMEKAADEVEEYAALLPIEFNLEKKLQDVNITLEKINKAEYGICEKCKKPITIDRLEALPTARTCKECK